MANYQDIESNIDVIRQEVLPNSNPLDKNSIDFMLSKIMLFLEYCATNDREAIVKNSFFTTCDDSMLDILGITILNLPRLNATQSTGYAMIQGDVDTVIPSGTSFSSNGLQYETTESAIVQTSSNNTILSATFNNGIVKIISLVAHNISSNTLVTISGFSTTDYNAVNISVNVIDDYTFTYAKTGIVVSPALGLGVYAYTGALIKLRSIDTGLSTNLSNGGILTIDEEIDNLNANAYVLYSGITGGSDVETNNAYRARCIATQSQYKASYNDDYYVNTAKKVNGVTRVLVLPTYPTIGRVTILFVRDNDNNILPNASQIQIVKDVIGKPSDLPVANIIIEAPEPIYYTVTISSLFPSNTVTQNMIRSVVADYFALIDIALEPNENIIRNNILTTKTIDGQMVSSFSIAMTPSGSFGDKSIAILNIVNFS